MRYRVPAAVALAAAVLLSAGAGVLGATMSTPAPSSATAFARSVLAEATVPPGGQPTNGIHTLEVRWLGGWGLTPGVEGVLGAHTFYLYDEPPAAVAAYVEAHPPPGVSTTGRGTADGVVKFVTETVPVSGVDEYAAWLTYSVAPTNGTFTRSELRIDAKTVWEPPRPSGERAPSVGVVSLTGYKSSSPRTGARGAVTVTVPARRAEHLIRDLNGLPLGASGACLETTPLWSVSIRRSAHGKPAFVADDVGCSGAVTVSMSGRPMPVLADRRCAVLRDVARLLPARAVATRSAASTCLRTDEQR